MALAGILFLTVSGSLAQPGTYDPRTWSFNAATHTLYAPGAATPRAVPGPDRSRKAAPRKLVSFDGQKPPGTIVISTSQKRLYLVLGNGRALQYAVGVGREGYAWTGRDTITRKREWPDWVPPAEMRKREAAKGNFLPVRVEGGPENPLGARALYIGDTLYRIHGTNQPWTVGRATSSGCIRMTNEDVMDLYARVPVGATVIVRE